MEKFVYLEPVIIPLVLAVIALFTLLGAHYKIKRIEKKKKNWKI